MFKKTKFHIDLRKKLGLPTHRIACCPGEILWFDFAQSILTKKDLAKILGISPQFLHLLIKGERNFSLSLLIKIGNLFPGTSLNFWLNLQNDFKLSKEINKLNKKDFKTKTSKVKK